jgi:signal transduction histidine kinase
VARHAGATLVRVELQRDEAEVRLHVRDNGRGFGPTDTTGRRPMGLVGMRERALTFGGVVEVESSPGGGTSVRARIPIGAVSGSATRGERPYAPHP